ncbi:hypothetical protein FBR05_01545, partial [Deltaproteobacteria bacterium PRO3]|nr:hypothetical protein [Deltaproteobacteria bacterium PRO3]
MGMAAKRSPPIDKPSPGRANTRFAPTFFYVPFPGMQVVHVNIPAFAVAVERRVDARLRGRPTAIAASSAPRAPLVAVSAEAFAAGIRAGDR